jgi:hypothetical protein
MGKVQKRVVARLLAQSAQTIVILVQRALIHKGKRAESEEKSESDPQLGVVLSESGIFC